jgi:2-polyprenyl-3-methyl-5-hydroxy-6-metoxy-1,4-benzoquinol methylase
MNRKSHWIKIWSKYRENEVSWFQENPSLSLDLILRHAENREAHVLDAGGGSSRLVDALVMSGFKSVGVLDIAEPALNMAQARLGDIASSVEWVVSDVTAYRSSRLWDIWHDRAVFHFLVEATDRQSYVEAVLRSLSPHGKLVISTFGPEGKKKCSGLDVERYSSETLLEIFKPEFALLESHLEIHHTPGDEEQQFIYCVFCREENQNNQDV